jgi:hypothetical protein
VEPSTELIGRWVSLFEKKLGPPTADAAYVHQKKTKTKHIASVAFPQSEPPFGLTKDLANHFCHLPVGNAM